jgi:hypothetical protein
MAPEIPSRGGAARPDRDVHQAGKFEAIRQMRRYISGNRSDAGQTLEWSYGASHENSRRFPREL